MDGGCLPVVTACTRVRDNNNRDIILIYNQALYNNDLAQHESLLHTHQANAHGVKINELPPWHSDIHGNPGLLSMQIEDILMVVRHTFRFLNLVTQKLRSYHNTSSRHHSHGDQNRLFWKPDTIVGTSSARRWLTYSGGNPYLGGNLITSSTACLRPQPST